MRSELAHRLEGHAIDRRTLQRTGGLAAIALAFILLIGFAALALDIPGTSPSNVARCAARDQRRDWVAPR